MTAPTREEIIDAAATAARRSQALDYPWPEKIRDYCAGVDVALTWVLGLRSADPFEIEPE
jgi:hypothetical protein